MWLPHRRRPCALLRSMHLAALLTCFLPSLLPTAHAITFTPAPDPNLDLSKLGRVIVAGNFAGASLFEFEEQSENTLGTNGSEFVLARLPNGVFASLVEADASIQAMCHFVQDDGAESEVMLGGKFTSLGGQESTAVAIFNPNDSQVTPLPGLSGQVNALLCDQDAGKVYVGGNFVEANSNNAVTWVRDEGWVPLPFAGFNGPVTSITRTSEGRIVFGGSFTGLGNASTPTTRDAQVINLSTAKITSGSTTSASGFSDPRNIICNTDGSDGSGNAWLLEDNTPGFWKAELNFGFQPSKLRLWNTHQDGRGTKTWRFTALPMNGIMNFTYVDPSTGENASCTSECPLSDDTSVPFQDFRFVNRVGMNAFRIDISGFYGAGGGLSGIELFEDDIFVYSINDFNEPTCAGIEFPSTATVTGPWTVTPSGQSTSQYLTAQLSEMVSSSAASVTFFPDIKEAGNFSVNMFTPGCIQDDTCATRGQVNITVVMTDTPEGTKSDSIFQTNNFDKYDNLYVGVVLASSGSFRPQVIMTPLDNQGITEMTFVAQRVGFTLLSSTGGLNGLFEYNPDSEDISITDFENSTFNKLSLTFTSGSAVADLVTYEDLTFVSGNFSSESARNIVAINSQDSSIQSLDGGLNGEVRAMYLNGSNLFVGGSFNTTLTNSVEPLNNVAVYDVEGNSWKRLGAGVDGTITNVVPLMMNIIGSAPEVVISFSGSFQQLEAFGDFAAVPVTGFAVWVPSQKNWLNNLDLPVEFMNGVLSASILDLPNNAQIYAGSLASMTLRANGVVSLGDNISPLPVHIEPSTASSPSNLRHSLTRRVPIENNTYLDGAITGAFDDHNGRNITILAGRFAAKLDDGSTVSNLLFFDGSNNAVTGLGAEIFDNSTFVAVALKDDTLIAGGLVSGNVDGAPINGILSYNMASKTFNTPQPPALSGGNESVSTIAIRPNTDDVYVGGSFLSVGSLNCPCVCFFNIKAGQWNQPGLNIGGTVNSMMWANDSTLLAGGDLVINGSSSTSLATYDATKQLWSLFPGSDNLPGPVEVLTAGSSDNDQIWVSGSAPNGSVFLMKYDGSSWRAVNPHLDDGTVIRSLQIFSLTSSHDDSDLVPSNQVLMITGSIQIPGVGSASAAYFDGSKYTPYILTAQLDSGSGIVSRIFSEKQDFFTSNGGKMPVGFVVLIGLGISLALMLIIVVAGLFLDRARKARQGYVPASSNVPDRSQLLERLPPDLILQGLATGRPGIPQI